VSFLLYPDPFFSRLIRIRIDLEYNLSRDPHSVL